MVSNVIIHKEYTKDIKVVRMPNGMFVGSTPEGYVENPFDACDRSSFKDQDQNLWEGEGGELITIRLTLYI